MAEDLAAPARVSPTPATEQEQNDQNNYYGFHCVTSLVRKDWTGTLQRSSSFSTEHHRRRGQERLSEHSGPLLLLMDESARRSCLHLLCPVKCMDHPPPPWVGRVGKPLNLRVPRGLPTLTSGSRFRFAGRLGPGWTTPVQGWESSRTPSPLFVSVENKGLNILMGAKCRKTGYLAEGFAVCVGNRGFSGLA